MNERDSFWLLILGGLLLLGGGGIALYGMTRGIRNNNPLNMEDDGENWEGLDTPRNDGEAPEPMLRFISPEYGIRAARISLTNAVAHDGIAPTVDSLIRHWSLTDQDAYVANVAAAGGVDPRTAIDLPSSFPWMIPAMITQENGFNPYSEVTLNTGLTMA